MKYQITMPEEVFCNYGFVIKMFETYCLNESK